jgi:hypothetical protein
LIFLSVAAKFFTRLDQSQATADAKSRLDGRSGASAVRLAMSVNGDTSGPIRRAGQHRRLFKPGFGLPLDDAELSAA